ncbi:hypothetical protein EAH89_09490 [Roseomonas nepalensis]|uniref:Uncharacterized protein n=1 Tax=Muricoccus nepalensis TaxID=1854500 RepID=A0A502G8F0_9PROT|nr:glycosyl hydrolase 108 family protein [Roseomonas nepalensis]TPG58179.1 hypothetical protein EAH89_09490 [Roseomonas nepalensis]
MGLPLITVAASHFPGILGPVTGDRTGAVAAAVAEAVREVAGAADAAGARAALAADAERAARLRDRLAGLAAGLAAPPPSGWGRGGEAPALSEGVAGPAGGGGLAWGPALVSSLVVLGFFGVLGLLVTLGARPEGASFDPQVASVINITVGTLGAAFAAVVNFWIGSSQSSRSKDAIVGRLQEARMQGLVGAIPAGPPAPLPRVAAFPAASRRAEERFEACLDHVLAAEGGFVNHPADPGGATNLGITRRTLSEFRDAEASEDDVRGLTRAEAREIYRARFWTPMRCAELPPGVDLMVFDFGVNAGPGRSLRLLQASVGVRADGSIGPVTLAAARACRPAELIERLAEGRIAYYRGLPSFATFGRGWTRRVDTVRQAALVAAAEPARDALAA